MAFDDVVAIMGDHDFWCLADAEAHYGTRKIQRVIQGNHKPGKEPLDDEGNALYACLELQNQTDLYNQMCCCANDTHRNTDAKDREQFGEFNLDVYLCPYVMECFPGDGRCHCSSYPWQRAYLNKQSVISAVQYRDAYAWYCERCYSLFAKRGDTEDLHPASSLREGRKCEECSCFMFSSEEERDAYWDSDEREENE